MKDQMTHAEAVSVIAEKQEEIETLRHQLAEKDAEIGQLKGLKDAGLVDDSNNSEPEQQRGMACSVEMGQLLERGQDKEAGDFETKRVFLVDDFRGDTTQLVASIRALVDRDIEGCLVPHGIGGHARALLSSASIRLEAVAVALAKKDAEIERLKGMVDEIQAARHVQREHNRLLTNLASSQLREHQLREALETAGNTFSEYADIHGAKSPPDVIKAEFNLDRSQMCRNALTLPTNNTALREMITEAGEVMRERCADVAHNYCMTLRALPGVTLEDLK